MYVYSYFLGWMLPPIIHIIAYYCNMTSNEMLNTVAITLSLIMTTIFYGSYILFLAPDDAATRYRVSATDDGVTHDMFNAVLDSSDVASCMEGGGSIDGSEVNAGSAVIEDRTPSGSGAIRKMKDSTVLLISRYRAAWMRAARRIDKERQEREAAGGGSLSIKRYSADPFVRFFEEHELMPRWWFPKLGERPGAYITAKNKKLHFLLTFCFYTGWVVVYSILMVMMTMINMMTINMKTMSMMTMNMMMSMMTMNMTMMNTMTMSMMMLMMITIMDMMM